MQWFFNLAIIEQIVIVYFAGINILTFFYFGWDKMRATLNKQRISERMLWVLALIGGSAGALIAMHFFRHKTKKLSFQAVLAIIIAIHIFILVLILK